MHPNRWVRRLLIHILILITSRISRFASPSTSTKIAPIFPFRRSLSTRVMRYTMNQSKAPRHPSTTDRHWTCVGGCRIAVLCRQCLNISGEVSRENINLPAKKSHIQVQLEETTRVWAQLWRTTDHQMAFSKC